MLPENLEFPRGSEQREAELVLEEIISLATEKVDLEHGLNAFCYQWLDGPETECDLETDEAVDDYDQDEDDGDDSIDDAEDEDGEYDADDITDDVWGNELIALAATELGRRYVRAAHGFRDSSLDFGREYLNGLLPDTMKVSADQSDTEPIANVDVAYRVEHVIDRTGQILAADQRLTHLKESVGDDQIIAAALVLLSRYRTAEQELESDAGSTATRAEVAAEREAREQASNRLRATFDCLNALVDNQLSYDQDAN